MDDTAFTMVMASSGHYQLPERLLIPSAGLYHLKPLWVTQLPVQRFTCTNVRSIHVPACVRIIGRGCFRKCKQLETVTFEQGTKIRVFEEELFANSYIQSLVIPKTVDVIGRRCFFACIHLTQVVFEKGSIVKEFRQEAFSKACLSHIDIPMSLQSIGDKCFALCPNLCSVRFEENSQLATIDTYAFAGNPELGEICLPASINVICSYAFSQCACLESVTIPSEANIDTLANGTFYRSGLLAFKVPASVKEISFDCFKECRKMHTIQFDEHSRLTKILHGAFSKTHLISIDIPGSVTNIYDEAFASCRCLQSVHFGANPSSLQISPTAFRRCPRAVITHEQQTTSPDQNSEH